MSGKKHKPIFRILKILFLWPLHLVVFFFPQSFHGLTIKNVMNLHILDTKENQSSPFWTKSLGWVHCPSKSSLAEPYKRLGGRASYSGLNISGYKFRKEKAKAGAGSCRGHLRSDSMALHMWAKADFTFPSHTGQAAQLNAHGISMEAQLWMCSLHHTHLSTRPKITPNPAQHQKMNEDEGPLPSPEPPWLGQAALKQTQEERLEYVSSQGQTHS